MDAKTKILYVDDEDINLELFVINFEVDFNIITAMDGISGLKILEKNPDIRIVISDMRMPEINGLEFIKQAKKRFPHKKYYILTGFEITAEIQKALDDGLILKYFNKPFNINEIDSTIKSALKKT